MNINLLIDAIVQQTTVLIAQLATAAGARTSLSNTANQVFVSLVGELKQQGLGNKLIAEMFGLSLRTYHNKIRRLSESSTEHGQSLWSAVLEFVQERGTTTRAQVLLRFPHDDAATVRSVLGDLTETGMIYQKGSGDGVSYRAAKAGEDEAIEDGRETLALANLFWISIARNSPIPHDRLRQLLRVDDDAFERVIATLVADGRVSVHHSGDETEYSSPECVIPMGGTAGWEASVFDHYQAMVTALCTKLRRRESTAQRGEWIGGSTYGFEVWPDHPFHDEVVGFLQATRDRAAELRARVDAYNVGRLSAERAVKRVIAYVGQTVIEAEEAGETQA
jgi:hypothetical protein